MPEPRTVTLANAAATETCGARLAGALLGQHGARAFVVHLSGELGSGKTTLVRGVLRALGITGAIHSPTYTLVETYAARDRVVAHLDLYRLVSPDELEALAVRELLAARHWLFIEWPERGERALPPADLLLHLHFAGEARRLEVTARTAEGAAVVQEWFR